MAIDHNADIAVRLVTHRTGACGLPDDNGFVGSPVFTRAPRRISDMSDLAPLAEAVAIDPLVDHPADYHVFHKFIERCKDLPAVTTAVVWPLSEVAMNGAVEAAAAGLIEPTLIGPGAEMKALAAKIGADIGGYPIVEADTEAKAAEAAVAMCRSGKFKALM